MNANVAIRGSLIGLASALLLGAAACSSDDSGAAGGAPSGGAGGAGGSAGASGSGGNGGATGGAGGTGGEAGSAGTGGAVLDASPDTEEGGGGPVEACSELGASDCFSNNECAAGTRCENAGTDELPVPCCVPGVRGAGVAGDGCTSENDCGSAVCIDGLCSATCQSAADCPDTMKSCIPIAFSGSDDNWCMPTEQ